MEPKYTAETSLELEDFRRYAKIMQESKKRGLLVTVLALLWIAGSGIVNLRNGHGSRGIFMLCVVIICPLIYLFTARRQSRRYYEKLRAEGSTSFTLDFYEDHFTTKGTQRESDYAYKDLQALIETPTDFYLEVAAGHCVIVQKRNCSEELIAFLHDLHKTGRPLGAGQKE